eukprot:TRINITY_DN9910_c0_g1_i1.p1 TRINITY_DN9910_c0_g1~~TRINITY_DN9910_c0_g1_i1.p1  ORF type:complete len:168 (-),score=13.44 TRINITY_DN9910_c0_g1_i1:46-549(-)
MQVKALVILFLVTLSLSRPAIAQTNSSCSSLNTCDTCATQNGCIWCENNAGDKSCIEGSFFGPTDESIKCWKYNMLICFVDAPIMIITVLSASAFLLIVIIVCLCCCLCGSSGSKGQTGQKYSRYNDKSDDEAVAFVSKTPKTDLKRKELSEKYGIHFTGGTKVEKQ